ncbi:MAG: chorismate synthase [Muribaculaceae bacterium]|nr:chorismate synthase [Muribaculaceae bacterium]
MNSFGRIFTLTSFGESHGAAIGGVVDGVPAGIALDISRIQHQLNRRRPGQSSITSSRDESDLVELLSGVYDGVTTGAPIGFIVKNQDVRSIDYEVIKNVYRPSHADYTYDVKYGIRDYRGGGRASARETVARIVAGSIAQQALSGCGITIHAYTSSIGNIALSRDYTRYDLNKIDSNPVRCPDPETAKAMESLIDSVKADGDTIGGIVTGVIKGVPAGLGEPVFDKLQARLASAMLSINAAKGFEYGMGFDGCANRGSEMNDAFTTDRATGKVTTVTNNSGGIQGGISVGTDIYFRVAFKPVATLQQVVETITKDGEPAAIQVNGRHDPCVVPRAVPVVEAMAAMTIFDMLLLNRAARI